MRQGRTVYIPAPQARVQSNVVGWILFVLALVISGGAIFGYERNWKLQNEAVVSIRDDVISLGAEPTAYTAASAAPSSIVHYTSHYAHAAMLLDPDFNFGVLNALKVRRVTEYCQWVESFTEEKDRDDNVKRTYYYTLTWLKRPVSSLLYDQPFRHNNPQRDPFPEASWVSPHVEVGPYTLTSELVDRVEGLSSKYVYYDVNSVQGMRQSPAALAHGFQPIGNGYFYSSYQGSTIGAIAQFTGMFLEGSVDIQFGDLFTHCTPGDIRVYFEAVDASPVAKEGISVLGQVLADGKQIGVYVAPNGFGVGLLVGGVYSTADALLGRFMRNSHLVLWAVRILASPVLAYALTWVASWTLSYIGLASLSTVAWAALFVLANGPQNLGAIVAHHWIGSAIFCLALYGFLSELANDFARKQQLQQQAATAKMNKVD